MFEWHVVPAFGGGMHFATHPMALRDDEWSWCNAFEARENCARSMASATRMGVGSGYLPGSNAPVGIVADARIVGAANTFLVPTRHSGTGEIRLFSVSLAGTVTEKTVSGTAAVGATPSLTNGAIMTPVLIGDTQVLTFGIGGGHGIATYNGTNYSRVAPGSFTLRSRFLVSSNGYVIIGYTSSGGAPSSVRQVRISDANDPTTWEPAISNSADEFTLDSATDIRAMEATQDGAIIVTGDKVYHLRATGSIPPFTLTQLRGGGMPSRYQLITPTPLGTLFWLDGRLVSAEGATVPGAEKCARYFHAPDSSVSYLPKMLWDGRREALLMGTATERLYFNPITQAWFRKTWEGTPVDHAMGLSGLEDAEPGRYAFVEADADVYIDLRSDGTTSVGAFVDTKDFAFGAPPVSHYISRIIIDWEPLNTASTDALRVHAYARDVLVPSGVTGTDGLQSDYTSQFVIQGTLTGAQRELSLNLKGIFTRFRFEVTSGGARIRGFQIRHMRAGDKGPP